MDAPYSPGSPADVLAYRVGASTVGENLATAVATGQLTAYPDGTWGLPPRSGPQPGPWLSNGVPEMFPCSPLFRFLFMQAYRRSCVPWGCRNCFKVKIQAATLRQLLALREVAASMPYAAKCGLELGLRQSSGIYAAFFYLDGIEGARAAFHELRRMVDGHPELGDKTPMLIKRGCTEYEMACGPSDRYTFAPELADVEADLLSRLRPSPPAKRLPAAMTVMGWVQAAYQIGDETYLDVTGGRRLYPKVVTYAPGPPPP